MTKLETLVWHATKAPSGHNTQPWIFRTRSGGLDIEPDFSRSLYVVDPDNHALFISLGCALDSLLVAAPSLGFKAEVFFSQGDQFKIHVKLIEANGLNSHPLFDALNLRQSNRGLFSPHPLPSETLQAIQSMKTEPGTNIQLITTEQDLRDLSQFIYEGSDLQFANKKFVAELASWCRFSESEARSTGDGIWGASMGMPGVGHMIGAFVLRNFVSVKSERNRWKKLIENTPAFALFSTIDNSPAGWVRLGQTFNEFALLTTSMGLHHGHVNMPCEENSVRIKLAKRFVRQGGHPLLLVRFGTGKDLPRSFRRPVSHVLAH